MMLACKSVSRPVARDCRPQRQHAACSILCQMPKQGSHRNNGSPATALGLLSAAAILSQPAMALAVKDVASLSEVDGGTLTLAVGGGAAIAGLGAILVATDPQARRNKQLEATGGDEKAAVRTYFNTAGFERWNKIYGETDDVNKVQLDIRKGHAQTVDKVLKWLKEEDAIDGVTVCDAGCGTGSLAIPLALQGATVYASDISSAMAGEAERRFQEAAAASSSGVRAQPKFEALDLESVQGSYNTVTCLDVMIHYPQDKVEAMIAHLAARAEKKLIISFAPWTPQYAILKRIGELFPGPSKATRAYLHKESDVEAALQRCGFQVVKKEMTATSFYFSRLFEAVRTSAA